MDQNSQHLMYWVILDSSYYLGAVLFSTPCGLHLGRWRGCKTRHWFRNIGRSYLHSNTCIRFAPDWSVRCAGLLHCFAPIYHLRFSVAFYLLFGFCSSRCQNRYH